MSNVQFNEGGEFGGGVPVRSGILKKNTPALVRILMRLGLTQQASELTLIGIFIVCVITTFLVMKSTFYPGTVTVYREDIPKEVLDTLPPEVVKEIPSRR